MSALDLPGIRSLCYGDEPLADLTAAGVSKAAMLERLRIDLGVAATRTLAVGDGINDLEMLDWAAHGVAMGHAPASVLAAADQICPQAPRTVLPPHCRHGSDRRKREIASRIFHCEDRCGQQETRTQWPTASNPGPIWINTPTRTASSPRPLHRFQPVIAATAEITSQIWGMVRS